MSNAGKLVLYETIEELIGDKEKIESSCQIDFYRQAKLIDLELDILYPSFKNEKDRQAEFVNLFLTKIWPQGYFEHYDLEPEWAAKIIYSNIIAAVLISLEYLLSGEIDEDPYNAKIMDWLKCSDEEYENYERMQDAVNNKIRKILKANNKSDKATDKCEKRIELPVQYIQDNPQKKFLQPLIKRILEMEGEAGKIQGNKIDSISWNLLNLKQKEKNIADFSNIDANERRSIKKIYGRLCDSINKFGIIKSDDKVNSIMLRFAKELILHGENISLLENRNCDSVLFAEKSSVPMAFYLEKLKFDNLTRFIEFKSAYSLLIRKVLLMAFEYAGLVLEKKQKEVPASDKIKMAFELMRNYINRTYIFYYGDLGEENKIDVDNKASDIGEHINTVMSRFCCERNAERNIDYYFYKFCIPREIFPPKMPRINEPEERVCASEVKKDEEAISGNEIEIDELIMAIYGNPKSFWTVVVSDEMFIKEEQWTSPESKIAKEWGALKELFKEGQNLESDKNSEQFQRNLYAFENGKNGFSIDCFEIEFFSKKKLEFVISGKDAPAIMKGILSSCEIEQNEDTMKIPVDQMSLMKLTKALRCAGASYNLWETSILKVRLGRITQKSKAEFEFCIQDTPQLTADGRRAKKSMQEMNMITASDTSEKI